MSFKYLRTTLCFSFVFFLASCMPDDAAEDNRKEDNHKTAQVSFYSSAFVQYAEKSLYKLTESAQWRSDTLAEGLLDLGALSSSNDMGQSLDLMDSAHCIIDDTSYHITFFQQSNSRGELFLKGIGRDAAGLTAQKISGLIPKEHFGIQGSINISMRDGTDLTFTGICSTLNIPEGSAVSIVPIPKPVQISETSEKLITRAKSCEEGMDGNILEQVMGTFLSTGEVIAGGTSFPSAEQVMGAEGIGWQTLSNNCITPTVETVRNLVDQTVDALDTANLIAMPGDINQALQNHLSNKGCKDVEDQRLDEEGEIVNEELYSTCAEPTILDILGGDFTITDEREEPVMAECGGDGSGSSGISVQGDPGIHSALPGKSGQYSWSVWDGTVEYKRRIYTTSVTSDFGTSTTQENVDKIVYEGVALQCNRDERLEIPCGAMYSPGGGLVNNTPLIYTRVRTITGWADPIALRPADPANNTWNISQNMYCKWRDTRDEHTPCPSGMEGSGRTVSYERFFEATTPSNGSWSGWAVYGDTGMNCAPPPDDNGTSSSGGGGSPSNPSSAGGGSSAPSCVQVQKTCNGVTGLAKSGSGTSKASACSSGMNKATSSCNAKNGSLSQILKLPHHLNPGDTALPPKWNCLVSAQCRFQYPCTKTICN